MCCSSGMLLHSNHPNHGDLCRDYDFTRQPAVPTSWTCPPGCDFKIDSPHCVQEGTVDPCRVEEGKNCGYSVCPYSHPILCPDSQPNHGDVCRAFNHEHICPEGCEISSQFWCANERMNSPCRT